MNNVALHVFPGFSLKRDLCYHYTSYSGEDYKRIGGKTLYFFIASSKVWRTFVFYVYSMIQNKTDIRKKYTQIKQKNK